MTDINPTEVAQAVTSGESNLSAASALIGDPSKFGRVDQDGTVYVLTSSGEKPDFKATKALTTSINKGSGLPMTAASATARA